MDSDTTELTLFSDSGQVSLSPAPKLTAARQLVDAIATGLQRSASNR